MIGNVELSMLLRQDSHIFRMVLLYKLAILVHSARYAVLYLIQKEVVSQFDFTLITVLIVNLHRQTLLFILSLGQVRATVSHGFL